MPPVEGQLALSFLDLIEVRFVDAFRSKGVPWKTIRSAAQNAMDFFGHDHPFSNERFRTDGQKIFYDMLKLTGENKMLDMAEVSTRSDE